MTIFREEATSTIAGFHAGPLSWSNWNLEMLVFVKGGKKPSEQGENRQQTQPTCGTEQESNPGHTGGRRALSPLLLTASHRSSLCSNVTVVSSALCFLSL